ncbi:MAG: T9SS type A sorting domain-containing protein, partial [Luteibaculaceae bacterium]
ATALNREKVLVNWSTAAEINNNYFLVERSHNARDFELVNQVWGAGFSNTTLQYSITDEPRTETNTLFYRLIQVDFDGTETIYGPVAVNFEGENSLTIFQAKGTIMLQYSGLESSDMQFNLVDMQGRLIQSSRQVVESGVQPLQHKPLPKGMYVVNAFNNRTQYSFKVVVP